MVQDCISSGVLVYNIPCDQWYATGSAIVTGAAASVPSARLSFGMVTRTANAPLIFISGGFNGVYYDDSYVFAFAPVNCSAFSTMQSCLNQPGCTFCAGDCIASDGVLSASEVCLQAGYGKGLTFANCVGEPVTCTDYADCFTCASDSSCFWQYAASGQSAGLRCSVCLKHVKFHMRACSSF